MIKEAYCSYGIYKLLREKGFDGEIHTTYDDEGYTQPSITHQMAMRWLREVHNLFILVGWNPIHKEYFTRIINMTDTCPKRNIHEHTDYNEAIEAALKYTLENLI